MTTNEKMFKKYSEKIGQTIGFLTIKDIVLIEGSYKVKVHCKCGNDKIILPAQLGYLKSCGCSYMRMRKNGHSSSHYHLDKSDKFHFKIGNAEAIIMLNCLEHIKLFAKNPKDKRLRTITFQNRHILLMPGETWIPYRLVDKFLKELPKIQDWIQEFITVKLSGMVTQNEKDEYITTEDLLKHKIN